MAKYDMILRWPLYRDVYMLILGRGDEGVTSKEIADLRPDLGRGDRARAIRRLREGGLIERLPGRRTYDGGPYYVYRAKRTVDLGGDDDE